MGAEKLAFVQKYLDDVQETRSTTTEASDSALGIHATTSEFETEEVRGKHNLTVVSFISVLKPLSCALILVVQTFQDCPHLDDLTLRSTAFNVLMSLFYFIQGPVDFV